MKFPADPIDALFVRLTRAKNKGRGTRLTPAEVAIAHAWAHDRLAPGGTSGALSDDAELERQAEEAAKKAWPDPRPSRRTRRG